MAIETKRIVPASRGDTVRYPVAILGVPVDTFNMTETIDRLDQFIKHSRISGRGNQIATVNADFITNALADPTQMAILRKASLAMPDGMPVVWGARMLSAPIMERVAGVDVVLGLAERAAQKGYSMYLLGAAPDVACRAAEILVDRFPGLEIVGVQSPIVNKVEETNPQILEDILEKQPDILLVAFGNPKQELWIDYYAEQLRVPVMIGVGGTLDFISGWKKRAPKWMQGSGLEWLYRLAQEPGRLWRRYGRNIFVFGPRLFWQWLQMRVLRKPGTDQPVREVDIHSLMAVISIQNCLTVENFSHFSTAFQKALTKTVAIFVDLSRVDFVDSAAFGGMVRLTWQVRERGGDLILTGAPKRIMRALRAVHLDDFFAHYPDVKSAEVALLSMAQMDLQTWPVSSFSQAKVNTQAQ